MHLNGANIWFVLFTWVLCLNIFGLIEIYACIAYYFEKESHHIMDDFSSLWESYSSLFSC